MEKKRIQWIDSLRAFACMSVVFIHVLDGWLYSHTYTHMPLSPFRWFLDYVALLLPARTAVPFFIMISGFLLLNPEKEIDIKKIKKYIINTLIILLIFGYAFTLMETIFTHPHDNPLNILFRSFINLLEQKSWVHMWYLYFLIGLYTFTPILKKAVKHCSENELKFILIMLFITSFIIPTINDIFHISMTTFYIGSTFFYCVFYYLMGYIIGNNRIFTNKTIYIGGIIGVIGYTLYLILAPASDNIKTNVFLCLYSIALFKLFSSEKLKLPHNKIIKAISKYNYSIYIFHAFWINLIYKVFKIFPDFLPIFVGEIAIFIYAMLFSVLTGFILSKTPYLNKIFK